MDRFTEQELNELDEQIEAQEAQQDIPVVDSDEEEAETVHYDINGRIITEGQNMQTYPPEYQLPVYTYPQQPKRNPCHKWPECPFGDSCRYFHPGPTTVPVTAGQFAYGRENPNWRPRQFQLFDSQHMYMVPQQYQRARTQLCRNYPDCSYGDSCRYIHPTAQLTIQSDATKDTRK